MARILTTEQVAEKLQVKPLTVRKYLRKGLIPGKRLGREWRVVETDLEMFISGGVVPEAPKRVSALGFLKDLPGMISSEEFMAEKRAEVEEEERRWEERERARASRSAKGQAA